MNANANAYAGYSADLIDVIVRGAERAGLPPLLLLALGLGESSLDPQAVGDSGSSVGVYQIHLPAHPVPADWLAAHPDAEAAEYWMGVDGTVRAMAEMRERWKQAYHQAGGDTAWEFNPTQFLAVWWPKAQGSIMPSWVRAYEVMRDAGPIWEAWQAANPPPTPEPEPELAPADLSPEWTLRVGLAEALTEATHTLLQAVIPAGTALGAARATALEVARLVDAAGGG